MCAGGVTATKSKGRKRADDFVVLALAALMGYSMVRPVGFLRLGEGTLATYGLAPTE